MSVNSLTYLSLGLSLLSTATTIGIAVGIIQSKINTNKRHAADVQERKERQAALDAQLNKTESSIEKLFSLLADHEEFANKISQGTLENQLYNEDLTMFKRLKAFLRLIAMRANGRIREQGLKLVLQNKEAWRDVLEAHVDLKIVDQKYFDEVMEDIDKRIFRY